MPYIDDLLTDAQSIPLPPRAPEPSTRLSIFYVGIEKDKDGKNLDALPIRLAEADRLFAYHFGAFTRSNMGFGGWRDADGTLVQERSVTYQVFGAFEDGTLAAIQSILKQIFEQSTILRVDTLAVGVFN